MIGVDRYAMHMTILSPMGRSIFACFEIGFTFGKTFLKRAWIYVMTLLASMLVCPFVVCLFFFFV